MPLSIDAAAPQLCASARSLADARRSTPVAAAAGCASSCGANDSRRPRVFTAHEPPRCRTHAVATSLTVGSGPLNPPIAPG